TDLLHYTPPTHIYTLSLHDALPIYFLPRGALLPALLRVPLRRCAARARADAGSLRDRRSGQRELRFDKRRGTDRGPRARFRGARSEEHTSELQSLAYLVCRLLLEKK